MNVFDILIFVLGIVSSVLITLFFSTRRRLSFIIYSEVINVEKYNFNDLKLFCRDKLYSSLVVTTVKIKNTGNRTIEGRDISESDRICIQFPIFGFIETKIKKSLKANNARIHMDQDKCIVNFDYLDKNDEIILLVLHEHHKGIGNVQISGKIKGCRLSMADSQRPYLSSIINVIMTLAITMLFPFSFIYGLCVGFDEKILIFSAVSFFGSAFGLYGFIVNVKVLILLIKSNRAINKKPLD